MMRIVHFTCLVCVFLRYCIANNEGRIANNEGRGKRNPSVIADDIYEALIDIVEGKPLLPVKERTKAQRSANVRYWRAGGKITIKEANGKKEIYFQGRRMLRVSEVSKVVAEEFDRTKGSGAAKIACSLRENYGGLSRIRVQNTLNVDKNHFRRNAKFFNKATIKPIRARDVQVRHQIDLMDMGKKGIVKMDGHSIRYVLSVMDVFSRFVWLRPLTGKCSKDIANELQAIYVERGPPRIIQSDRGSEFKSAVKKLCRRMNIKTIYSRPYHPQSQGKVERSHRSLRAKMAYDFTKMGEKGVNWVKSLPTYQRILNNDPKEVLRYKTPFEVYFGRKCYSYKTGDSEEECIVADADRINPTATERRRRSRNISQIRQEARKATNRCDKRMQKAKLRSNPPAKYSVGENVFVRLPGKGKKKRHVIESWIEKRNLKLNTYKIAYTSPVTGKNEKKWVPVDDVTSLNLQEEKRKQRLLSCQRRKQLLTMQSIT